MNPVISVEHLGKVYQLGQIGTGTFANDLKIWWAMKRGRPNPLGKISKAYLGNGDDEEVWALRDVSFQVAQGEVLGVIGRNGAGKSTLLKILSQITSPTFGCIKVKGRVASLLEVGTGFHPELTGMENIYLNGAILGMSKHEIDRKFDEIVDFAEIEKFIHTPVKRYSSGMYIRLAFAVAAHLEPEILVVDEVLAVGDSTFQKKCLGKMEEVAGQGRSVLFVSHNMAAVRTLCKKGIVLHHGNMAFIGDVSSAIRHYQGVKANETEENRHHLVSFYQVNIANNIHNTINSGEGFVCQCSVKIKTALNGFNLFCILQNGDGDLIVHAHADHHKLPELLSPGDYQIKLNFPPLWLKPGVYSLHFKLIPNILARGHLRFLSDTVMLDVNSDVPPELLLGELTPETSWQLYQ